MTDNSPVATGDGAMYYVVRPWESGEFKRCRRAWDYAARERRNLEPIAPPTVFDFAAAIHDALDVYYFPGMWTWNREVVHPLALKAFRKAMAEQRDRYAQHRDLSAAQERDWAEHVALGDTMLERYFRWAPEVDNFNPVQVATQFDVPIPVPGRPDEGMTVPDGRTGRFRVRVDMVVIDDHELYWLVEHRITGPDWAELDALVLDEGALSRSWAWQQEFLGTITGTVHNELRMVGGPSGADPAEVDVRATDGAHGYVTEHGNEFFRRTAIPRGAPELARRGVAIAHELRDMIDPELRVYPSPDWAHCAGCAYRAPCLARNQGLDEAPILAAEHRRRDTGDFQPGKLGSIWGFMPNTERVADHVAPPQRNE